MYPDHAWGMVIGRASLHGSNLVLVSFGCVLHRS